MLAKAPQRLARRTVAVLLGAAHLIVGAAGDSLFYLFESPVFAESAGESSPEAYFHHHGDGLWHHHGSPIRRIGAESEVVEPGAASAAGVRGSRDRHVEASSQHDHSTLLLALASTLELSLLLAPPALELPHAIQSTFACEIGDALPLVTASLGPRGPPVEDCC